MIKITPFLYKIVLSLYPPYLGAGVRIKSVSTDWKEIQVMMTRYWFNKNEVGTHFGGSLYSMTDPHIMFMLMHHLGNNYIIWDKAAEINYIKDKTVAKSTKHKFYLSSISKCNF